jgi:hypothetical protein
MLAFKFKYSTTILNMNIRNAADGYIRDGGGNSGRVDGIILLIFTSSFLLFSVPSSIPSSAQSIFESSTLHNGQNEFKG